MHLINPHRFSRPMIVNQLPFSLKNSKRRHITGMFPTTWTNTLFCKK